MSASIDPYSEIFSGQTFQSFAKCQRELRTLHVPKEDVRVLLNLSTEEISNKIQFSRILINNLSLTRDESAIDRSLYSDGTFVDPIKVFKLYEEGCSIILRAAHRFFPSIAKLTAKIGAPWCCDAQANIYLSKAGVRGTPPHFDAHELFIFQVLGSKTWEIYELEHIRPETNEVFNADIHRVGALREKIQIQQGDVLFLPRGTVHRPIADTDSVHVSFGVKSITYKQLIFRIIDVIASVNQEFSESVLIDSSATEWIKCIEMLQKINNFSIDQQVFESIRESLKIEPCEFKTLKLA